MITQQNDWRNEMKLFNMFKRKPQQILQIECANLSTSNDCTLVSEIKRLQSELENTENTIKSLRNGEFNEVDLSEIFKFIATDYLYYCTNLHRYGSTYSNIEKIEAFSNALKYVDLNEFIKEITILYDRKAMISDKEHKASELRAKIAEAKSVLGIK
jgi:hypothetical protein